VWARAGGKWWGVFRQNREDALGGRGAGLTLEGGEAEFFSQKGGEKRLKGFLPKTEGKDQKLPITREKKNCYGPVAQILKGRLRL